MPTALVALAAVVLLGCGKKAPAEAPATPDSPSVADAPASAPSHDASHSTDGSHGDLDRAAPTKAPLACAGITSELSTWVGGSAGKLSLDDSGRASIVVSLAATDTPLPDVFAEDLRRASEAFGHVAATDLCTVAGTSGVTGVRAAHTAESK